MHQTLFRLGLRPRPRWERLQRSPINPSWKGAGLLLGETEGREKKARGLKKGGEGKVVKKCSVPPPTFE